MPSATILPYRQRSALYPEVRLVLVSKHFSHSSVYRFVDALTAVCYMLHKPPYALSVADGLQLYEHDPAALRVFELALAAYQEPREAPRPAPPRARDWQPGTDTAPILARLTEASISIHVARGYLLDLCAAARRRDLPLLDYLSLPYPFACVAKHEATPYRTYHGTEMPPAMATLLREVWRRAPRQDLRSNWFAKLTWHDLSRSGAWLRLRLATRIYTYMPHEPVEAARAWYARELGGRVPEGLLLFTTHPTLQIPVTTVVAQKLLDEP